MEPRGIELIWVVVQDFQKAIVFYRDVLGFTLVKVHEEFQWAEFHNSTGCRFGVSGSRIDQDLQLGNNAIPTITVKDIEAARHDLVNQSVVLLGKIVEIPGRVRLQLFQDGDGNHFQLCQLLY